MNAMILAAGRGERMRPLTDVDPKPLLKVGEHPLIVWHILRLRAAGIDNIVINHAWLGHKIEAYLGNGSALGVNIAYSPEPTGGLETGGGIATALPLLGEQAFMVVNGDVLMDVDFAALAAQSCDGVSRLAHILLVDNPEHHPEGDFGLLADGLVAPSIDQGTPLTFSGAGVYHPVLLQGLAPLVRAKLPPYLRAAMAQGKVSGAHHQGTWFDVGTPERLQQAQALVAGAAWTQCAS
ncbi:MAG: nucleotidyltransferase family protein [Neisseriaceae bacterium]|nr:nucleotidyltransferase family protein [Neisseriaceae bacterium]MBP6862524.1 nucleotidyltransferase family protein [Neisseriaceae bacterium]